MAGFRGLTLEEAMARLAEAQARTEVALQQTQSALQQLARQVRETVGDIEDIAYIVLHEVLGREFGWQVGVLKRTWQTWNGESEEVNIFGRATDPTRPERPIWIVGEAKHNAVFAVTMSIQPDCAWVSLDGFRVSGRLEDGRACGVASIHRAATLY